MYVSQSEQVIKLWF